VLLSGTKIKKILLLRKRRTGRILLKKIITENENKGNIIIKRTSYETYIIKRMLLLRKRCRAKVIILLPGTKIKRILLLKRIL